MSFWGSAGDGAVATISGDTVEVDVAVNDDDQIRIAAWSEDLKRDVEMVFTPAEAAKVRDQLTAAITEGRWLA
ncbi:hypothetical protein AB0F72_09030 [Actinoplanes sp. NPDC023936]|uniref:hypothetical protein n=1 Tax=Actinoplanes sp. NPDC023936 TaxID=3154910 RepID=UPI0033D0B612